MAESWTVLKILQWTTDYFRQRGIDGGRLDAELLLSELLGLDRVGLYLHFDRPLQPEELAGFRRRVERRAKREPLQYILGQTEFWSLSLKVTPAVLIPRADTEVLVEAALDVAPAARRVLDLGTGSGAIALALATELDQAQVEAVDICEGALAVARENVHTLGLEARVSLCRGDMASVDGSGYDLVVSNPPYIPVEDLAGLMPEVRDFEPAKALSGGPDGLDFYRLLAGKADSLLASGGWLLLEVGIDQAEAVSTLLADSGLQQTFVRDDYAGIPRVVGGRKSLPPLGG